MNVYEMENVTICVLLILCLFTCFSFQSHVHYYNDDMREQPKLQLKSLCRELLRDMMLKQRQLLGIKQRHTFRVSYEVGRIMGGLREKYKRIMDVYREILDRHRGRNYMLGPGHWELRPFHYVIALEIIKGEELHIDKMVEILHDIPVELLNNVYAYGNLSSHGMTPPFDPDAHRGVSGLDWLRNGSKLLNTANTTTTNTSTSTRAKPHPTISRTTKLNVDYQGSPAPVFKSQKDLKKYYRERYESTEKPKDKALFLDRLYGIV